MLVKHSLQKCWIIMSSLIVDLKLFISGWQSPKLETNSTSMYTTKPPFLQNLTTFQFKSDILFKRAMKKLGREHLVTNHRKNFKYMARQVLTFLRKLRKIKINLEQLVKFPIFPTRPYLIRESKQFLVAVNLSQYHTVKNTLMKNRMMIFQIDSVNNFFYKKCDF